MTFQKSARAKRIVSLMCAVCWLGWAGASAGAGRYLTVDYPASSDPNGLQIAVTYTLWIPDGAARVRAIIVHQHGAGTTASKEGSTAAYDLHWQALAAKWDAALFCSSYHVLNESNGINPGGSELWFDPRRGSEKTFLRALDDFAAKSGHPEIATVPWALWGHSGGGIWADVMSTLHPERVIAMWLRSGSAAQFRTHPEFAEPEIPAACYAIPIMLNPGVKERAAYPHNPPGHEKGPWWGNLATFTEYRAKGAFVGFAPDPRTGHECGDSRYLAIPYLDACLAMRLPGERAANQSLKPVDTNKVWLASLMSSEAEPAKDFKGNPHEAVWLPNEAIAKAWMEYVKTGAVSDSTPPPAPYDVKMTPEGDQGTEITWSADADFESGIRCFIVRRDGQDLAQVPEKPVGKFGRPLFQSMTYHDTPDRPLPQMRYLDVSAKADARHIYSVATVNSVKLESPPTYARAGGYEFDGTISRAVLENYLSRSITMEGLLNGKGDLNDDIRMLKSCGAKFIGRSICLWGGEADLLRNFERARKQVPMVLAADPEMILEACIFEIVSKQVEKIPVPDWAFEALGQPVEKRNFRYLDMIYPVGQRRNWGGNASVPDVSRPETKLWFYFLARSYIDLGFEAIHWGQVEIMNKNDRGNASWEQVLSLARAYAALHARRHMVLCDAHVPSGGLVREGRLLLDFHAFPLRIKENPDEPEKAILKVGFSDGIYGRSKGGLTYSGWKCEHLPYLVELDNYGVSKHPGKPNEKGNFIWVWGYDEISWFAHQSRTYRSNWLNYAWDWVRKTDPAGYLEMPGSRTVTSPLDHRQWYFANRPGPAVPSGEGDEDAIRAIWSADSARSTEKAAAPPP